MGSSDFSRGELSCTTAVAVIRNSMNHLMEIFEIYINFIMYKSVLKGGNWSKQNCMITAIAAILF